MGAIELKSSDLLKLLGTGLVCFGLLAYEIFTARLLSVVLEPELIIFAIALAMLGMGAATSLSSMGPTAMQQSTNPRTLGYLSLGLGISYLVCLVAVTQLNQYSNIAVEQAIDSGGLGELVNSIRSNLLWKLIIVGSVLAVPYFVFGVFISKLFKPSSNKDYHRLYAADLIGAALGCISLVVALDFLGYSGALAIILIPTFLGAAAFSVADSKFTVAVTLSFAFAALIISFSPSLVEYMEPQPELDRLVCCLINARR